MDHHRPLPTWIWRADKVDDEWIYLRKSFDVAGEVKSAKPTPPATTSSNSGSTARAPDAPPDWGNPILNPAATKLLKTGKNVIAAKARNRGGAAAFVLKLEVETTDGKKTTVLSEPDWKLSLSEADGWKTAAFDDASWTGKLKAHGKFGVQPWGVAGIDGPGGGGGGGSSPLDPADITVAEGFKVELLYNRAEGGTRLLGFPHHRSAGPLPSRATRATRDSTASR